MDYGITIFLLTKYVPCCSGDLALTLLVHYKDDSEKLARIMDKLLDREVHQLIKAPLLASYYSSNPPTISQTQGLHHQRGAARNSSSSSQQSTPQASTLYPKNGSWVRAVCSLLWHIGC